jgi:hypothetical protein
MPASLKKRAAARASSASNGRTSVPWWSSRPRTVFTRSAGTIRGGFTQK